jgi:hypothetical protein
MFAFFMLCVAVEISSTAFGNRVDPVFPNLSPIAFITRDVIIREEKEKVKVIATTAAAL